MKALRRFQALLSKRLLAWSILSLLAGARLRRQPDAFWRGVGSQAAGWGAVDAGIGLGGYVGSRRKLADPAANTTAALAREAQSLRKLLWLNAGLDILYVAGGLRLLRHRDSRWHGHGLGIIAQGLFLLVFDIVHALTIPGTEADDGKEIGHA